VTNLQQSRRPGDVSQRQILNAQQMAAYEAYRDELRTTVEVGP
jgi:hypothetical protein